MSAGRGGRFLGGRVPEPNWSWDIRPDDVVTAEQRVVGEVLDVNTLREQIQLALRPRPLAPFVDRVGRTVLGQVPTLLPFGAVVRVADGVEGTRAQLGVG
ncbi:hypothetical protein ACIRP2_26780 [Streptomyces sp. NPDC101194]|uniref:hypothetical protein n=1 Tax=Streptomyces sp. NPDC101194 TaxID=3366127 RepID=UPI00380E1026